LIIFRSRIFLLLTCLLSITAFAQKGKPLSDKDRQAFDFAYMNGNKEKILENYTEAIKYFEACYKLDPDNAALNFIMGDTYFQKKQLEAAELYAEAAVKLDNSNTWYKELLVDIYVARRKNKEAAELMAEIGNEKKEADYLFKAAYLYSMIKEYKTALKLLDRVEKNMGISEDVVIRKEQIYLAQNKLDKAIKEVQKLIKAYPDNLKYRGMLADLYWANGKAEDAARIYADILKQSPDNGFAAFALADYYKLLQDNEKWYEYLKRGMASTDVDTKAKVSVLSSFMEGTEFPDQQKKLFELSNIFAAANPGDPMPYLVLGDVYAHQQKYDSARVEYRKALAIEPSTYIAWQQLVFCTSQLFNNELLLADCEDAITYFPNEPAFYAYGAIAATQLKNYTKTIELASKGLEITTPDQEDIIAQLNATLADAYHYTKNYKASDSIYEATLTKDPDNAYALNNYAYFLSLRKTRLEKAEQMSKRSIELDSENASYLDTYGWILFTMGDYTKSKEYIEKSLEAAPNNAEVLDHLGDVLFKLGDKQGALKQWKKAQDLGADNPVLQKKISKETLYE
jgi:tetratricopeptide (TPR) repeat protein